VLTEASDAADRQLVYCMFFIEMLHVCSQCGMAHITWETAVSVWRCCIKRCVMLV